MGGADKEGKKERRKEEMRGEKRREEEEEGKTCITRTSGSRRAASRALHGNV